MSDRLLLCVFCFTWLFAKHYIYGISGQEVMIITCMYTSSADLSRSFVISTSLFHIPDSDLSLLHFYAPAIKWQGGI